MEQKKLIGLIGSVQRAITKLRKDVGNVMLNSCINAMEFSFQCKPLLVQVNGAIFFVE